MIVSEEACRTAPSHQNSHLAVASVQDSHAKARMRSSILNPPGRVYNQFIESTLRGVGGCIGAACECVLAHISWCAKVACDVTVSARVSKRACVSCSASGWSSARQNQKQKSHVASPRFRFSTKRLRPKHPAKQTCSGRPMEKPTADTSFLPN